MKRSMTLCGLICVLIMCLYGVSAAQKGANFAGTWELDKSKSKLPQMMADNIQNLTWMVTQDDKQVSREVKMEGTMSGGGGGGQGGGRGGMGAGMNQPMAVKLDGSETVREMPAISGKTSVKSKWIDGGKILEIVSVMSGNRQGQDFQMTTTEHWELAEGGKVLKVHQKRETQRGPQESEMVFNKK